MISAIDQISYTPISSYNAYKAAPKGSLSSFEVEDKAIISSQAKLLNELDKYQRGESNELNLALTSVTEKTQIEAVINVIKTKNELSQEMLKLGE